VGGWVGGRGGEKGRERETESAEGRVFESSNGEVVGVCGTHLGGVRWHVC
jgi:hypothetical protein